eukprot:m.72248 g.72248  ORF g.72248 m.72248 type:complete len:769 (+) comp8375_c0_seq1:61-2367(+)
MKLELSVSGSHHRHGDVSACVGWSASGTLISAGDDHKMILWNSGLDDKTKVIDLSEDQYPTSMMVGTMSNRRGKQQSSSIALAFDNGKFVLMSPTSGKTEKKVDAHTGAVTSIKWSSDGQSIMTAGEDGRLKIWSRAGMLRATLAQSTSPIYGACWNGSNDKIIHTANKHVAIVPLKAHSKTESWLAHEGVVLCVDWSAANNNIITGGEDRKYKVWDAFGTLLYASGQDAHPVTAISWANSGDAFLVGSFNSIRLCDCAGWTQTLEKPHVGSVYAIQWDSNDTKIGCACSSGDVVLAQVVERSVQSEMFVATQTADNTIVVRSVVDNSDEELEFREAVIGMQLAHGYLVVTTESQCVVYKQGSWTAPSTINLKAKSIALVQARSNLIIVDDMGSIQIYSYSGRLTSTINLKSGGDGLLNSNTVALSDDTVAIVDQRDGRIVHIFDLQSGKEVGHPIQHTVEVSRISLDQGGDTLDRTLAIIDKTNDLHLVECRRTSRRSAKLATAVTQMVWDENYHILLTLQDAQPTLWLYPTCVFLDESLLPQTRVEPSSATTLGKAPTLLMLSSSVCVFKRADGAIVNVSIPPYLTLLHFHVAANAWQDAIRLCRFVKDESLWATFAVIATQRKELTSAEIAFAAIHAVDKVEFLQRIKSIPTVEGRDAEMALFTGQVSEAASILLKSGLIYRLIDMFIRLYQWDKALDTAIQHKTHVDTVIGRRQRYLESIGQTESKDKFLSYAQSIEINWDDINAKIETELENEKQRPGAKPFS